MSRCWPVVVCLAVAVAACDQPSPASPIPGTPGGAPVRRLEGWVKDTTGAGVAGATIADTSTGVTTVSDSIGRFEISVLAGGGDTIAASKIGFESASAEVGFQPSFTLVLSPFIRIPVGQSARVTFGPNSASGDDDFGDEFKYQVIRVYSDDTVTADLRVVADDKSVFPWLDLLNVCCGSPNPVTVSPGVDVLVRVRIGWDSRIPVSRSVTVLTSRIGS